MINASRLPANLMTLGPAVLMNTAAANARGGGTSTSSLAGKVQSSLTITHVSKLTPAQQQQAGMVVSQQQQGSSQVVGGVGIIGGQQQQSTIAQIVSVGPQSGTLTTSQGHQLVAAVSQQHQLAGSGAAGTTTVLPLTATGIASRTTTIPHHGLIRPIITTTANVGAVSSAAATHLPIAKVIPQQQQQLLHQQQQAGVAGLQQLVDVGQHQQPGGNIFIHSRSPNPVVSGAGE